MNQQQLSQLTSYGKGSLQQLGASLGEAKLTALCNQMAVDDQNLDRAKVTGFLNQIKLQNVPHVLRALTGKQSGHIPRNDFMSWAGFGNNTNPDAPSQSTQGAPPPNPNQQRRPLQRTMSVNEKKLYEYGLGSLKQLGASFGEAKVKSLCAQMKQDEQHLQRAKLVALFTQVQLQHPALVLQALTGNQDAPVKISEFMSWCGFQVEVEVQGVDNETSEQDQQLIDDGLSLLENVGQNFGEQKVRNLCDRISISKTKLSRKKVDTLFVQLQMQQPARVLTALCDGDEVCDIERTDFLEWCGFETKKKKAPWYYFKSARRKLGVARKRKKKKRKLSTRLISSAVSKQRDIDVSENVMAQSEHHANAQKQLTMLRKLEANDRLQQRLAKRSGAMSAEDFEAKTRARRATRTQIEAPKIFVQTKIANAHTDKTIHVDKDFITNVKAQMVEDEAKQAIEEARNKILEKKKLADERVQLRLTKRRQSLMVAEMKAAASMEQKIVAPKEQAAASNKKNALAAAADPNVEHPECAKLMKLMSRIKPKNWKGLEKQLDSRGTGAMKPNMLAKLLKKVQIQDIDGLVQYLLQHASDDGGISVSFAYLKREKSLNGVANKKPKQPSFQTHSALLPAHPETMKLTNLLKRIKPANWTGLQKSLDPQGTGNFEVFMLSKLLGKLTIKDVKGMVAYLLQEVSADGGKTVCCERLRDFRVRL